MWIHVFVVWFLVYLIVNFVIHDGEGDGPSYLLNASDLVFLEVRSQISRSQLISLDISATKITDMIAL